MSGDDVRVISETMDCADVTGIAESTVKALKACTVAVLLSLFFSTNMHITAKAVLSILLINYEVLVWTLMIPHVVFMVNNVF